MIPDVDGFCYFYSFGIAFVDDFSVSDEVFAGEDGVVFCGHVFFNG